MESEQINGQEENVRVVVRVRPLSTKEQNFNCINIVNVDTLNRSLTVKKPGSNLEPPKTYTFDYAFDETATQMEIYSETTRNIVDSVIDGYNGTILAYGQTGTGKTYTMTGNTTPETRGIIPNTFAQIFGHIAKADPIFKFLVCVTYIEIYNEEIRDLITNTGNLEVRENNKVGVFVNGLTGYICKNADEIDNILKLGSQNRIVAATAMNEESSRSHAILNITVESSIREPGGTTRFLQGKLSLVDLAGSERQHKTHAAGIRLKESAKINLSLSVLGNVISALVDGKSTHVPYRNSKLTRLLQDSLGGNSKTVMIATIGPADTNYEETISTLRYANRAKNIQNHTKPNEEPHDTLIRAFEKQINDLKRQLEEESMRNPIVVEEIEVEEDEEEEEVNDFKPRRTLYTLPEVLENQQSHLNDTTRSEDVSFNDVSNKLNKTFTLEKNPHHDELNKTISEQAQLKEKLSKLEEKILVGGENLLDKAQIQEQLLEESAKELERRRKNEEEILESIKNIEMERIDIEERYNNLAEAVDAKTKELNNVAALLATTKSEYADLKQEQQREMEGTLENMRSVTKDLQLADIIINEHIPLEYYKKLESFAQWNEEIGEWQLKCVAYTGNHMRKHEECRESRFQNIATELAHDIEFPVYMPYLSHKPHSKFHTGVPRPKTAVLSRSRKGTSTDLHSN
ncbi:kinesin-like protein KIF3A [Chrysoperla carnea]|uniref:kinesin-like protein KIF3A n=1 Tax=Chrysoperla carnea TaxID=189513 RepID=UPI001D078747|nr:kinesin-like protein KIF3A [Chrysoperla carnea]